MVKIMAKVADYEKYMQELENILEKLQTEEISLDETLTMYAKVAVLIDKIGRASCRERVCLYV